MIAPLIIGGVLVLGGIAGIVYAKRLRDRVHAMIGAETLPIPELEQRRSVSDEVAGKGQFRHVCEVVGTAHPNPQGPLTSEITKSECVWHRHKVQRRYRHVSHDSNGRRRTSQRTETVAEHTSHQGYALRDATGTLIGVDPNGTDPDAVEQAVNRFEPYQGGGGGGGDGILGVLGSLVRTGRDDTIGYEYTEWVIRPGTPLYILGEVHDKIGPLVIGKPAGDDPFIISTRSEQELRSSTGRTQLLCAWGGAAGILVGIGLLIAGALT